MTFNSLSIDTIGKEDLLNKSLIIYKINFISSIFCNG